MISFTRKFVFSNSIKNQAAPYIFLILCAYAVIISIYTAILFPADMILRFILGIVIVAVFVAVERSPLSVAVTAFLSPMLIAAILTFGAFYFNGDGLLFIYMSGIAMISLTYFSPKGLAAYILAVGVVMAVILFICQINLLGAGFTMVYNIISFIASMGLNALAYFFCTFYVKMLNALTEAKNEANLAAQAKGAFLANMSHEIRTPLNAIIGMTSIAKATDNLERKDYAIEKIKEASNHLLGIINDVLDISKIESGKFELSETEFNFENMLHRVVNVINFRVEEKQQKLTVYIDRAIPKNLIGDDQRIAQVITNLLGNAVKFTPEKGFIRIGTQFLTEENGVYTIQISVTDTGIGISPEKQARLFKSFEQAESDTSRKFGGTGLGLAISKNIVEMMGGKIWIESDVGAGSKFAFTIQVRRGANEKQENTNWGNIHILAVDSDPYVLSHFQVIAKGFGICCDTAESYDGALQLIKQNNAYDLCFVNWKIQGADGLKLINTLKEKKSVASAVLMISSTKWVEIEDEAKKMGVDKFLSKPLFPSDIANIINECLDVGRQAEDTHVAVEGLFAGRCILLAEDVEINREIVRALLEPTRLEIDCAANGVEAVHMFSQAPEKFDMIFMDVQMPEMDGYEATKNIRALDTPKAKTIPIIAMTANVFREDVEKCHEAGMNDHIGKPLDLDVVIEKLRAYLR